MSTDSKEGGTVKNVVRGVLALVLTAMATWLANEIAEQLFGPEEGDA